MPIRGGKEFHIPTLVQSWMTVFDCSSLGEGYFLIAAAGTGANSQLSLGEATCYVKMYPDSSSPSIFRSCAVVQIVKVGDSYDIYVFSQRGALKEKLLSGITTSITLYNGNIATIYKLD